MEHTRDVHTGGHMQKDYLLTLSSVLTSLRECVNADLSELVDREKALSNWQSHEHEMSESGNQSAHEAY